MMHDRPRLVSLAQLIDPRSLVRKYCHLYCLYRRNTTPAESDSLTNIVPSANGIVIQPSCHKPLSLELTVSLA